MSLTPEAERRIEERIQRVARRGPRANREELRQHVSDAALDLAGNRPATATHVDEAFDGLGSDDEVRVTFFPQAARPALDRIALVGLVGAALLATAAIVAEGGGDAACSVEGAGSCTASTSGYGLDVLVMGTPPVLVMACLIWWPAVAGVALAALYAAFGLLRALDTAVAGDDVLTTFVVAVAGLVTLAIAIRHLLWERRSGSTSHKMAA